MTHDRRAQIEEHFDAALELPPHERGGWLERTCAGDAELLAEVQALLAAHELAEQLFREADEPRPAPRVGPYRLVRELGRGGMGVVYLAERADGQFQRRVAIKLIATSDAADPLHQRFLAERQILAGLDHPNIARLLDGAVTDDGRPYLVLEYVDGLPITAYCDRHRLGVAQRLQLFLDVCAAVQHAHQNLIIHRDLKPSNILVAADGQVRLLDFGIAKLVNPALSAAAAPVTRLELRAMTPEYASPEQVRGEPLTTASDLYSLGVLLYELLVGVPPYRLDGHSPAQLLEAVCEREPPRPSTMAQRGDAGGGDDAVALRAAARAASADRLARRLRGDLDGIVMMALRKEPRRRYGSAELLAQDIRRHLEGLPIAAHRGGRRYRLGKLVRRHRVEVLAAAVVVVSLLAGTAVAGRQALEAGRARDRAESALEQAEEVTRFLMGLFQAAEPGAGPGVADPSARELLRRGVARADQLADQPIVQARLLDVVGQMYSQLGQYAEAQRLLERAVAIQRTAPGAGSLELADMLLHLSWVHRSRSELAEAHRLAGEALAIRRAVLAPDHPDVADAVYQVGRVTVDRTESERLYREALELLQRSGADQERQVNLLHGLSTHARRAGRFDEAVRADREALRLALQVFGTDDHRTGYAMVHLADQVRDLEENLAEADSLYRRGLHLLAVHLGDNHVDLLHGLGSLAFLRSRAGDHAEAEQLLRRSIAIRLAAAGPEHPALAGQLSALAGALERQGRLDEAERLAREATAQLAAAFGPNHRNAAFALARLGSILLGQGRYDEGAQAYGDAIAAYLTRGADAEVPVAETRRAFGRALTRARRFGEAEAQLLESLATLAHAYGDDHPNTQDSKRALMELYQAWGRPELAERYRVPPGIFVPY